MVTQYKLTLLFTRQQEEVMEVQFQSAISKFTSMRNWLLTAPLAITTMTIYISGKLLFMPRK